MECLKCCLLSDYLKIILFHKIILIKATCLSLKIILAVFSEVQVKNHMV